MNGLLAQRVETSSIDLHLRRERPAEDFQTALSLCSSSASLGEKGSEAVPLTRNTRSQKLLASAMARIGGRSSGGSGGGSGHTFHHSPTYNIHAGAEVAGTEVERWIRKGHSDFQNMMKNWEHEVERRSFDVREDDLS